MSKNHKQKSPAFSFYASNFIAGTLTYSLRERGAYITLLAWQWDHGSIPDEAKARCRVLGCTPREERLVWNTLRDQFSVEDGVLKNHRLECEREKQQKHVELAITFGRQGGKKSQEQRKGGSNPPPTPPQPSSFSLSPSPSPSVSPSQLVERWNTTMTIPIPQVKILTEKRRRKLLSRIRELPDLEIWTKLFRYINTQEWCRGEGSHSDWTATLDWLIHSQDNLVKQLEKMDTPIPVHEPKLTGRLAKIRAGNLALMGDTK